MPTHRRYQHIYIGAHACDDGHKCFANGVCTYMGSGKAITRAVKEYGVEQFKKDTLAEVESEHFLYQLEAAVVDGAFVDRDDTYNLKVGGQYGTFYRHTDESKYRMSQASKGKHKSPQHVRHISEALRGKPKTETHRRNLSMARTGMPGMKGEKHPQFGKPNAWLSEWNRSRAGVTRKPRPDLSDMNRTPEVRQRASERATRRWELFRIAKERHGKEEN